MVIQSGLLTGNVLNVLIVHVLLIVSFVSLVSTTLGKLHKSKPEHL